MTKEKVIHTLTQYQKWRRYDGPIDKSPEIPDPKEVGRALDWVINYLNNDNTK